MEGEEIVFWDTIAYNEDTFESDRDPIGPPGAIAELWFRLDVDEIVHAREIYQFLDWMGDVGGCKDILMAFFAIIFGGYINFTSDVETMLHMYSKESLYRSDSINTLPRGSQDRTGNGPDDAEDNSDDLSNVEENGAPKKHLSVDNFSDVTIDGSTRIKIYIYSTFGCLNMSCVKKYKALKEQIDTGIEQQESDFDI